MGLYADSRKTDILYTLKMFNFRYTVTLLLRLLVVLLLWSMETWWPSIPERTQSKGDNLVLPPQLMFLGMVKGLDYKPEG